jgi:hypothetical protein
LNSGGIMCEFGRITCYSDNFTLVKALKYATMISFQILT